MRSFFKELIKYRNLLSELIGKDLKLRYSLPVLGFLWAFISPFFIVGIFYLVFVVILNVQINEAPFVLYLMSAIFTWKFFSDSVMSSVTSLVDNKNLIRESSFPQYLIPLSIVLSNTAIFLPALIIVSVVSAVMLKGLSAYILMLPVIVLFHIFITASFSIVSAILYVRWRDLKYFLEVLMLLIFYATPVFYSVLLVKQSFSSVVFNVYINNPFTAMLDLYRISLLKGFYVTVSQYVSIIASFVPLVVFGGFLSLLAGYSYRINKNRINDYLNY